jgi:hypothetical protein
VKVFEFPFGISIGSVCDLDFGPSGTPLSIQGTANQQFLIWDGRRVSLPDAWTNPDFPFVRALPDGRVLVVDTGFEAGLRSNAWILRPDGGIDANFEIGSAAVEICCLWGLIAVAYHPISARAHGYTVQPLQKAGVAFYDLTGRLIMGLNQELARVDVSCDNVRCMTALSRSQILFAPERLSVKGEEVLNPIVLFDVATRRPTIHSGPHPRPEALTMDTDGLVHLASLEGWEDQIITFDPESKISQHRGEFLGIFRGLEGGAFLSQLSSSDYVVIVPEGPEITSDLGTESAKVPELVTRSEGATVQIGTQTTELAPV